MRLTCYSLHHEPPRLRPAPATREWMDATPQSYAYRCLPLNIANAHGWEVLCPQAFTAVWDGGVGSGAISVTQDGPRKLVVSHFGSGILTFHVEAVFRTEPGWNLWVQGPVNQAKHGIAPLTGVIETDWSPYSFTMNWRFTAPDVPVRFEEGEPFCHFFPVARGVVDSVEPEMRMIQSDPETARQHAAWTQARSGFLKDLKTPGSAAQAEKWQKAYYVGRSPDGAVALPDHQTKLRPRSFVDRRDSE